MTGNQEETGLEKKTQPQQRRKQKMSSSQWVCPPEQPEGKRQQFTESASDKGNQEKDR